MESGQGYAWMDDKPIAGARYWVEDIDMNGQSSWHGPLTASKSSAPITRGRSVLLNNLASSAKTPSTSQIGYPAEISLNGNLPTNDSVITQNAQLTSGPNVIGGTLPSKALQTQWRNLFLAE